MNDFVRLAVVGTGYVGLTTGAALAYLGHQVACVDKDQEKLSLIRDGACPIHELGLAALMRTVGLRLAFTDRIQEKSGLSRTIIPGLAKEFSGACTTRTRRAPRENSSGPRIRDPRGEAYDFRYALDCSRIREELGWRSRVEFEEGLQQTVEWYLENQDWVEGVITGEYQEYYRRVYVSSRNSRRWSMGRRQDYCISAYRKLVQ
jgi:nucleoside-diphosphate-sugar epimerase